jgi:hypothetical protein
VQTATTALELGLHPSTDVRPCRCRDSTELRSSDAEEAASLRQASGYQEVALVGRGGARLGSLGAVVPGGGTMPSPMLMQVHLPAA